MSELSFNYQKVKDSLLESVNLIAVSKTKPAQMISNLYSLGHRDFGENKVQELYDKSIYLEKHNEICWHFIGHLQSNKINQLLKIKNLKFIHSIDRVSLLDKLLQKQIENKIGLFIQVNTSAEDEKGGFTELDQIKDAILKIKNHPNFYLKGLMTIGKIRTENFEQDARSCFSKLLELKNEIEKDYPSPIELSMGMSNDYLIAQEMGAHWLRVGSKIFGNRD